MVADGFLKAAFVLVDGAPIELMQYCDPNETGWYSWCPSEGALNGPCLRSTMGDTLSLIAIEAGGGSDGP